MCALTCHRAGDLLAGRPHRRDLHIISSARRRSCSVVRAKLAVPLEQQHVQDIFTEDLAELFKREVWHEGAGDDHQRDQYSLRRPADNRGKAGPQRLAPQEPTNRLFQRVEDKEYDGVRDGFVDDRVEGGRLSKPRTRFNSSITSITFASTSAVTSAKP